MERPDPIDSGAQLSVELITDGEIDNNDNEDNGVGSGYEADSEASTSGTLTPYSEDEDDFCFSAPLSRAETPVNPAWLLTVDAYIKSLVEGATTPSEELYNSSSLYEVGVDPNALADALNDIESAQSSGRFYDRAGYRVSS